MAACGLGFLTDSSPQAAGSQDLTLLLALIIDLERCTGCKSCKTEHELGPGKAKNDASWPPLDFHMLVYRHCDRPGRLTGQRCMWQRLPAILVGGAAAYFNTSFGPAGDANAPKERRATPARPVRRRRCFLAGLMRRRH